MQKPHDLMNNSDANSLAHVAEAFLDSGTSRWHRRTVEWLVVYLFTEAVGTPHNIRQGRSSITLLNGYHEVAQDLKERQNMPWVRGESVRLVRLYLGSLDELRAIQSTTAQRLIIMRGLLADCEGIEEEYVAREMGVSTDDEAETMSDRVKWAISMLEELDKDATVLVDHFETALGEVTQPLPQRNIVPLLIAC